MSMWRYTALFFVLLIFPFTRQLLFLLLLIYLMYQWLRPTLQAPNYSLYCPPKWSSLRSVYLLAFWTSFGALAKKKGFVTQQDIQIGQHLLTLWKLGSKEWRAAKSAFYVGKDGGWSPELILGFKEKLAYQPHVREAFWTTLLWTCTQKGTVRKEEWLFLRELAFILGLDEHLIRMWEEQLDRMSGQHERPYRRTDYDYSASYVKENSTASEMNTAQAFKILGVSPGASFTEIKRAYRQLTHHYHPDKLIHRHLSQEEKERATERLLRIQKAYAHLKAQYGL